jgi:protein-arginine kinase activator protein McsA
MKILKCHVCKRVAIVRLQRVIDGTERTIALCAHCAKSYGVLPYGDVPFAVVVNVNTEILDNLNPEQRAKCCRKCGCTLEYLKKNNHVGCPQCYGDLREELYPLVTNMHKAYTHRGKRPKGIERESFPVDVDKLLEGKLQEAMGRECFEDAVRICQTYSQNSHEIC